MHNEDIHGKLIPGFPGYSVEKSGTVWTFRQNLVPTILKCQVDSRQGYLRCRLMLDGRKITRKVHQLVALAYLGPREKGIVARHIDSNKSNNHLSNLAYGTHAENTRDACLLGDMSKVLDRELCLRIYKVATETDLKQKDIAEMFGVNQSTVSRIKAKKIWVHAHE